MTKPSLDDLKRDYKNYLIKIRDGRLCCICINHWNEYVLADSQAISRVLECGAISNLMDYHSDLTSGYNIDDYDIVAVYYSKSELEILRRVLLKKEPEKWDWQEDDIFTELTMEEVCKALGKNIKIVKEK